ncbi:MAG: ABC transporter substrate-binding protein [Alphaproteobacteria bacterium]|nr:ABC transporter substrate-binding protein [Alphaproteobacteria bacterium]
MKKLNWKSIVGWGVAALVIVGIIGTNMYQMREQKTDKPIVKIGITMPLTGAMGKFGQEIKKGIELRLSQIPENTKYHYEVIYEDDQLQASKEFTNAQKLINFNNVDVVISTFAGSGPAIADLAKDKKVIHFDNTWTDKIAKSSPYTFMHELQPADTVKLWMDTAYKKGYRRVSIINNDIHAGGEYVISEAQRILPNYPGMQIVDVERVPVMDANLRTVVAKMNTKNPDLYLSVLLSPTTDMWGKILKEQEIKTPTSSIDLYFNATNLSLFNGGFVTGPAFPAQRFNDDYVKAYGERFTNFMTPFVYDVIDILVKTYEKYDTKPSGEQISHDLLNLKDYSGIFRQIWVDKWGMFHNMPVALDIKDGQLVPVEE